MAQITFLHTGDIHLGAPIRGLSHVNADWADKLVRAIPQAYERVIRTAIDRQVDFVVFAGDSFDEARASYSDFKLFFDGLARLDAAGIPSYLVTGNHDPYTSWEEDLDLLPPSAHLLGVGEPQFALFEKEDKPICMIGARSYFNQTWSKEKDIAEGISRNAAINALEPTYPEAAEALFAIGIIHTGLDLDPNKAPANSEDLLARGMDYWACGHMHRFLVRPGMNDPRIVFPGCVQGRALRETGRRGCVLVTLQDNPGEDIPVLSQQSVEKPSQIRNPVTPSLEFIPTASIVFENMEIDVAPFTTLPDLAHHIQTELFRVNSQADCENMILHITLRGESELSSYLSQSHVLERIRKEINDLYPSFFCDELIDRTRPVRANLVDESEGSEAFDVLVKRIANEQRQRDQEMVNFVQDEFVKRQITVPDSLLRRMQEFEDAAELRIMRLLEEADA